MTLYDSYEPCFGQTDTKYNDLEFLNPGQTEGPFHYIVERHRFKSW